MSHFGPGKREIRDTPQEWLRPGAQIGKLVNDWAGRDDLVVFVGPGAGRDKAAALFDPFIAEIEVNPEPAFGKVDPRFFGDIRERAVQYDYPAGTGAIAHEAGHARFTTWDLMEAARELSPTENDAMHNLEETRMERLLVQYMPNNRVFLRACALGIVMADMTEEKVKELSATRAAARAMALVLARVDAGVLNASDVEFIRPKVLEILGEDLADKLTDIYRRFQRITVPNTERMYHLAREWDRLVQEAAEARGEGQQTVVFVVIPQSGSEESESSEGGQGDQDQDEPSEGQGTPMGIQMQGQGSPSDKEGEGSGSGEGDESDSDSDSDSDSEQGQGSGSSEAEEKNEKALGDILGALAEDRANAEADAEREAADQQSQERAEQKAQESAGIVKEHQEHQKVSAKVFGIGPGPVGAKTSSKLIEVRPPASRERIAAVQVSKELMKAKYRDSQRTMVSSATPPGRLRTRDAVQQVALRSKGIRAEVEPWRHMDRKRVDEPKLTIGVMTDISGSMGGAMEPMAVSAWVMSEAVRRIDGKVAMVHFGNDVFPTLMPREHLDEIRVYSARDGAHDFKKAFQALDGTLTLLRGTGARLLVVSSDGQYGGIEGDHARYWMARCRKAGVAVLWLGYSHYSDDAAKAHCEATGAHYVYVGDGVVDAAKVIGRVAAEALTKLGRQG